MIRKMAADVRMETSDIHCKRGFLKSAVVTNIVILKSIFAHLPARDLNKCARVCALWAEEIRKIKRTRKGMAWDYFVYEEEHIVSQLTEAIEKFVKNLYFEPGFAFIFCSTNLYDETKIKSTKQGFRLLKAQRTSNISQFIEALMPSHCKFSTITADGIIGTSRDMKRTEEMEGKHCISFIVFSELTYDIVPLYYDLEDGNKIANLWSNRGEDLKVERLGADKHVKSVVFLCDEAFCPQEVGFSLYKMYRSPMIAGGFVDNVVCPPSWEDNDRDDPFLCCLAFCGRDVQVASVVIKDDVKTTEEVDKLMKKLKDFKIPEKNSVGFMFACVGRGEQHYGEKNVESTVFRKYFPNTPLVGFFGNGEVGFQYPHTKPNEVKNSKEHDEYGSANHKFIQNQSTYLAEHPPKMYHAYTTIMAIMSF